MCRWCLSKTQSVQADLKCNKMKLRTEKTKQITIVHPVYFVQLLQKFSLSVHDKQAKPSFTAKASPVSGGTIFISLISIIVTHSTLFFVASSFPLARVSVHYARRPNTFWKWFSLYEKHFFRDKRGRRIQNAKFCFPVPNPVTSQPAKLWCVSSFCRAL